MMSIEQITKTIRRGLTTSPGCGNSFLTNIVKTSASRIIPPTIISTRESDLRGDATTEETKIGVLSLGCMGSCIVVGAAEGATDPATRGVTIGRGVGGM